MDSDSGQRIKALGEKFDFFNEVVGLLRNCTTHICVCVCVCVCVSVCLCVWSENKERK